MTSLPLSDQVLQQILDLLEDENFFVFLETTRLNEQDHRSFLFLHPVDRLFCTPRGTVKRFFQQAENYLKKGYYLAGWFGYEFGYFLEPSLEKIIQLDPDAVLANFGVFPPPHLFDHQTGTFSDSGPWPVSDISSAAVPPCKVGNFRLNETEEEYLRNIRKIKSYIEAGDTYQVNYTLKLLFDFSGPAQSLYKILRRNQSVSYCAYLKLDEKQVLSFSPELFFKKQGENCTVRPMKGTIGRGRTLEEDGHLADFLQNDIKNRSENVMIADLLRNDLGKLSDMGTVQVTSLFDVEHFETVSQMTSSIKGRIRPHVSLLDIFQALFPCGSVTGAPKIRTMEIIHELEKDTRGIYTGGIGFISPKGEATFNVPIRTIALGNGSGEMGIGAGIVYDSEPEKEWAECMLKARFLTKPAPEFKLIETVLWLPGAYWLLDLHLERLNRSAKYFGFPLNGSVIKERLGLEADQWKESGQQAKRVRLTLAKDGTLSVTTTPCGLPATDFPPLEPGDPARLQRVTLSSRTTDSKSPYLYHKTTMRHLYEEERQNAITAGFFEVIFFNEQNEATEGSISNIFIKKDEVFFTPPLSCGLLDGVFRRHLLSSQPLLVRERILTAADLVSADALYIGNSVRGIVQVRL